MIKSLRSDIGNAISYVRTNISPAAPEPKSAISTDLRQLCRSEQLLWKFDQAAPLNGTVTARIKGPLTEAALRAGLAALQARHPYLRTRIEVDASGRPSFRLNSVGPLPLRVVDTPEDTPEDTWVHELERELNEQFQWQDGPLGRCVLLQHGPENATVLLTLHHTICDGQSVLLAMRDLLQAAGQATLGQRPELPPLDDTRSVEDRLPHGLLSKKGFAFLRNFLSQEIRLRSKYGVPFEIPKDQEVPVHARRFRCLPTIWDEARTAKLVSRAREEGTSVHGALCAATVLGALHDSGVTRPVRVFLGSAANLRDSLVPTVGDDVGYYAASLPYAGVVRPDVPFWDLARSIREQLLHGQSQGVGLMTLDMGSHLYRLFGAHRASPPELADRWSKLVTGLGVSNMGRQDLPIGSSPLSVEALYIAAALSAFAHFATSAMTFRNRLVLSFLWADPVVGQERVERLASAIAGQLDQASSRS